MTMNLSAEANINFINKLSLIQEYKLIDDSTWFLVKDKFVADIAPIGSKKTGITEKTTTYRNIIRDQPFIEDSIQKNKIIQEVIVDNGARDKNDDYWEQQRHEELSKNEKAVYKMIDTLQKMPVFIKYTNYINFIGTGYLNVGNYQIGPWQNLDLCQLTAKAFACAGISAPTVTSAKTLLRMVTWPMASGDQKFKYEGDAMYLFSKHPRVFMCMQKYSKDLDYGQQYLGWFPSWSG